jgi:hypothetical protein
MFYFSLPFVEILVFGAARAIGQVRQAVMVAAVKVAAGRWMR